MTKQTDSQSNDSQVIKMAVAADQAGDKVRAARFYHLAGEQAMANYAYDDALGYFSKALERTSDSSGSVRYRLLFAREEIYAITGKPEDRSQNLVSLTALADTLDDDRKRAESASRLALYKLDNGDHQDAISIARLAVRIAQVANAPQAEATLHLVWGRALIRLAEYDQARRQFERELTVAREANLVDAEAAGYRYLGVVNEENGRFAEAKSLYKQALAIFEMQNDRRGASDMLNNLGKIAFDQGEYTVALRYWDHAQPEYAAIGDKVGSCRMLINQSALCLDIGDYAKAKAYSSDALALSREIQLRFGEALSLINQSLAHHHLGENEAALTFGKESLTLAQKMESRRLEGYAHTTLGRVLSGMDQLDNATVHFWESLAIWHELDQPNLAVESHAGLADISLKSGEMEMAETAVSAILEQLQTDPTLDGAESIFSIYLTAYQVLAAAKDARADGLLQTAYEMLQARAADIADEASKASYLTNVAAHKQIGSLVLNR